MLSRREEYVCDSNFSKEKDQRTPAEGEGRSVTSIPFKLALSIEETKPLLPLKPLLSYHAVVEHVKPSWCPAQALEFL